MSDNGQEVVKACPLGKECETCLWSVEMAKMVGGMPQKFNACAVVSNVTLLSEMNLKTQMPQQKIELSNLLRG